MGLLNTIKDRLRRENAPTSSPAIINIFLDVDGVLNTNHDWWHVGELDERCVRQFAEYLHHSFPASRKRIFLTSSWNRGYVSHGKCTPQVERLKQVLFAHGLRIYGKTGYDDDRSSAVRRFIMKHHIDPATCIVIDDTPELFETALPRGCKLYIMDSNKGFCTSKMCKPYSKA